MNPEYLNVILINVGLLLIASWVLSFLIFSRQIKDKSELEARISELKKKLKEAKAKARENKLSSQLREQDPNYPLAAITTDEDEEEDPDANYLLHTIDQLNNELLAKDQKLAALTALHEQQQQMVDDFDAENSAEMVKEFRTKQQETQAIVYQLRSDLQISQKTIRELEIKLREGQDKDGRIAILEETEKRLRNRLRAAKESGEQTSALVEGLRKANDKNKHLKRENQQLMANIRKMTTAIKNHQEAQSRS